MSRPVVVINVIPDCYFHELAQLACAFLLSRTPTYLAWAMLPVLDFDLSVRTSSGQFCTALFEMPFIETSRAPWCHQKEFVRQVRDVRSLRYVSINGPRRV
jgi:hypothetical protein